MDNITDLVNAAMEDWDNETNCGETDPAFQGEVGEEIETLVNNLGEEDIERLLSNAAPPVMFLSMEEIEEQYKKPNPFFGMAPVEIGEPKGGTK